MRSSNNYFFNRHANNNCNSIASNNCCNTNNCIPFVRGVKGDTGDQGPPGDSLALIPGSAFYYSQTNQRIDQDPAVSQNYLPVVFEYSNTDSTLGTQWLPGDNASIPLSAVSGPTSFTSATSGYFLISGKADCVSVNPTLAAPDDSSRFVISLTKNGITVPGTVTYNRILNSLIAPNGVSQTLTFTIVLHVNTGEKIGMNFWTEDTTSPVSNNTSRLGSALVNLPGDVTETVASLSIVKLY